GPERDHRPLAGLMRLDVPIRGVHRLPDAGEIRLAVAGLRHTGALPLAGHRHHGDEADRHGHRRAGGENYKSFPSAHSNPPIAFDRKTRIVRRNRYRLNVLSVKASLPGRSIRGLRPDAEIRNSSGLQALSGLQSSRIPTAYAARFTDPRRVRHRSAERVQS